MEPEGLDRINVSNDPVNWVDPFGLWALDSPTASFNSAVTAGNYAEAKLIADAMGLALKGAQVAALKLALYMAAQDAGDSCSGGSSSGGTNPNGDDGDDDGDDNYENPGHHDPSNRGPNPYNPKKSVLPKNHRELWNNSRSGPDGNRWTKAGRGRKTVYHRFQNDGNGNWHWNGSTDGMTNSGIPRRIRMNDVPKEVKRW
ncbi:MAG: hypothetical protein PVH87_21255 [Desulfobacteraceae bacterium]